MSALKSCSGRTRVGRSAIVLPCGSARFGSKTNHLSWQLLARSCQALVAAE
jgi:hypothetical protein